MIGNAQNFIGVPILTTIIKNNTKLITMKMIALCGIIIGVNVAGTTSTIIVMIRSKALVAMMIIIMRIIDTILI